MPQQTSKYSVTTFLHPFLLSLMSVFDICDCMCYVAMLALGLEYDIQSTWEGNEGNGLWLSQTLDHHNPYNRHLGHAWSLDCIDFFFKTYKVIQIALVNKTSHIVWLVVDCLLALARLEQFWLSTRNDNKHPHTNYRTDRLVKTFSRSLTTTVSKWTMVYTPGYSHKALLMGFD
jgi:hypothetical protein